MSRYGEQLKDPRWQRKRLDIMNRDKFTCQLCGKKSDTLNVHHLWYGKTPWDVPNNLLITLCETCHVKEECVPQKLNQVFKYFSEFGVLKSDMIELCLAAMEYHERTGSAGSARAKVLKVIEIIKGLK